MNICFINCFYKTELWYEISKGIEASNNIYWISTSKKWSDWLISKNISPENILDITRDSLDDTGKLPINIEENDYNLKISNIILMDRILREKDGNEAKKYLLSISDKIYAFLKEKQIKIVFGEATAAHEIITSIICSSIGIKFFNPFTIRIPTERFAFFEGPFQERFYEFSTPNQMNSDTFANEIIESIIVKNKKPSYFYLNNNRPKINIKLLATIGIKLREIYLESRFDMSVKPLKYHLLTEKKYIRPLRYKRLIMSNIFESVDLHHQEKFILFPLHVQPEASIDVLGYKYSNQMELIKSLSRILPLDTVLYVKEHTNALGQRDLKFYKTLNKLSNVKLVDPFIDTRTLIDKSELVITVSGTVALECGVLGKKAVTLSKMFFNKLKGVYFINDLDNLKSILNKEVDDDQSKLSNIDYYKYCLEHSFDGLISDTQNTPEVLNEKNIKNIHFAFNMLLEDLNGKNKRVII